MHRIRNQLKRLKFKGVVLTASLMPLVFYPLDASAQSQNWNLSPRAKSQNANSRALNFLELDKNKHSSKSKGALDQAISILLEGTQADPTDPLPWATLGLALNMKGRYEQALDALTTSYKLDHKRAETLLSIAITQLLTHNYDAATEALGHFLREEPNNCSGRATLGFVYMRKGDLDKALEAFHSAVDCRANSEVAYHGLAETLYLKGDFTAAIQAAEHAQSVEPYEPVAVLLAELSFLTGDNSAMTRYIQQAAKASYNGLPVTQRSMTALGYMKQHDFHFDPYLLDDINDTNLVALRALSLPKQVSRQKSLVHARTTQADISKGEQLLASAPNDFFVLHQVAMLNLAVGNYEEAIAQFTKLLTNTTGAQADLLYLARALELAGRRTEAAGATRQYQKDHPDQKLSSIFTLLERSIPAPAEAPPLIPPEKSSSPEAPSTGF